MMSNITLNVPINPTSLGQVSICLLRELFESNQDVLIDSLTDHQLEHENQYQKFFEWIVGCSNNFHFKHSRKDNKTLKLWHISQSLDFLSNNQTLFTFHETDSLTDAEINILNQQSKVIVSYNDLYELISSECDTRVFKVFLPFDKYNFKKVFKKETGDNRIVFNLVGKYEPLRKRHNKVISAWIKEFGDNPKYELRCGIANPFYQDDEFKHAIQNVIKRNYFNVQFLGWIVQNSLYNDFINQGDIVIGMGNEAWGLPEFHSVGLGKHAVLLDCLGHKEWANEDNSCLVKPSGMIPADNDKFFQKGYKFNQGNLYDFNEHDFIESCYQAIDRFNNNPINENGLTIQKKFNTKSFLETINTILES